jgi:hypothetical protein
MSGKPSFAPPLAVLCAAVLTAAPPAAAQSRPLPLTPAAPMAANDAPKQPNAAALGDFAVAQAATDNAAHFVADWNAPTRGANLHVTHRIARNRPLATFITYRGCRTDPAGHCNVTATFELIEPSGKIDPVPEMPVSVNESAPAPGMIYLSQASMGLTFNDADPLGVYTIRAAVTDHVAGVTLHTQQDITLTN